MSTTKLSKKAQDVADDLGIEVRYIKMGEFPRIKCNINKQGKKIYHLPFDQQYDRVQSQQYVSTVAEAEKEDFKRAFKWHGKQNKTKHNRLFFLSETNIKHCNTKKD